MPVFNTYLTSIPFFVLLVQCYLLIRDTVQLPYFPTPLLVTTSAMFGPRNLFGFVSEHRADNHGVVTDDLGTWPLRPVSFFPANGISGECRLCRWSRKLICPTVWSYNSLLIA